MIRQKSKTMKNLLCLLLLAALILPTGLTTTKVQAASKPSIESDMAIGTGSINCDSYVYSKDSFYTLEVFNPVKKATYSFTSSNKNIVTVKAKGAKAYLTGVKAGKATITCQQKLNGKTTKVGTCKVSVENAKIYSESYDGLAMGTNDAVLVYYSRRNCDAKYTFTSNSKNFTVKDVIKEDSGSKGVYVVSQSYTAKEPGIYTVTVKETYKKKTRVVGKAEYEVKKATVFEEYSLVEQESIGAFSLVQFSRADSEYYFGIEDTSILEETKTEDGGQLLTGKKAGTTTVKVYEGTTTADESKLIGTCKITVDKLKVESLDAYFYDTKTYVGGESIEFEVYKEPENAPEKLTITSSDPAIATVSELDQEGVGKITPVKAGKVTITITCGEFTKTETITVYADEDAMYED